MRNCCRTYFFSELSPLEVLLSPFSLVFKRESIPSVCCMSCRHWSLVSVSHREPVRVLFGSRGCLATRAVSLRSKQQRDFISFVLWCKPSQYFFQSPLFPTKHLGSRGVVQSDMKTVDRTEWRSDVVKIMREWRFRTVKFGELLSVEFFSWWFSFSMVSSLAMFLWHLAGHYGSFTWFTHHVSYYVILVAVYTEFCWTYLGLLWFWRWPSLTPIAYPVRLTDQVAKHFVRWTCTCWLSCLLLMVTRSVFRKDTSETWRNTSKC